LKNILLAVQGMGKVGAVAAALLEELGAKIIAVSDVSGGLYSESGLDIEDIRKYLNSESNALLVDYTGKGEHISNEQLLSLKVDVLIPAAIESQITSENAEKVRAKIIVGVKSSPFIAPE